jgi:hypothetical protein
MEQRLEALKGDGIASSFKRFDPFTAPRPIEWKDGVLVDIPPPPKASLSVAEIERRNNALLSSSAVTEVASMLATREQVALDKWFNALGKEPVAVTNRLREEWWQIHNSPKRKEVVPSYEVKSPASVMNTLHETANLLTRMDAVFGKQIAKPAPVVVKAPSRNPSNRISSAMRVRHGGDIVLPKLTNYMIQTPSLFFRWKSQVEDARTGWLAERDRYQSIINTGSFNGANLRQAQLYVGRCGRVAQVCDDIAMELGSNRGRSQYYLPTVLRVLNSQVESYNTITRKLLDFQSSYRFVS